MWKAKYQPRFVFSASPNIHLNFSFARNHVPWAIITACSVASALLLLLIRYVYAAENKHRENQSNTEKDSFDEYYISELQADGTTLDKKVDRVNWTAITSRITLTTFWLGIPGPY
jgi:hypothetical protein